MYNVIVVDDEFGTLEATAEFVHNICDEFEVTGRFSNGEDALNFLLNNHVDLCITDIKMPKMNGLELAKAISESKSDCTVIIISGYRDFEYARTALKYGVIDYITKPINFGEFSLTLRKIKDQLDEKGNVKEIEKLRQEQFMSELYFGSMDLSKAEETFDTLNFEYPLENLCGYVIELEFSDFESFINLTWKHDKDQLDTLIYNIFNSVISCQLYTLSHNNNTIKLIAVTNDNISENSAEIEQMLNNFFEISSNIKIIMEFQNYEQLASSKSYLNNEQDCMMLLMSYIKEGNIQAANSLYDDIIASNTPDLYEESTENDAASTVKKVKLFLEENYNRDIGRSDVAKYVYMNEAYIGRIFKQQTGKSIHDYHMDLRLKKALEMLGNGEKISVICQKIGYSDKRKFIRNFKHYTGYAPNEYRKNVLKLPSVE